jgi:RNA polymerase sigma-70 factor (ECF subfamily)
VTDESPAPAASTERNARLAALLSRVALSDQRAFEDLYRQTGAHLYAVAVRIVRDAPVAEEILQEAFVSVWHHAGSYDAAKSHTVTLHRGDDETLAFDPPSDGPTPIELLLSGADARAVRDCVDSLESGPKQAIALAFFQGLSHAELAAHLREPLGTVKSWVRRALEKLRRCLDRAGVAG